MENKKLHWYEKIFDTLHVLPTRTELKTTEERKKMKNKDILVSIFIRKNKILSFLEFIKNKLRIPLERIFIYEIENNDNEYLVTYKTSNKTYFLTRIHYSTALHIKNRCIFSINALNKYIVEKNGEYDKNYQIDWGSLENKLIILNNGELKVLNITKIENNTLFS